MISGFLPIFVRRVLDDEADRLSSAKGAEQRALAHVDDVVESLLLVATVPEAVGEVFNVNNDERLSLREIVEVIVVAVALRPSRVGAMAAPTVTRSTWRSRTSGTLRGEAHPRVQFSCWFAEGMERTIDFFGADANLTGDLLRMSSPIIEPHNLRDDDRGEALRSSHLHLVARAARTP